MPIIERTGSEFYQDSYYAQHAVDRGEITADELERRYLSHDVLVWGDYLGQSSDVQVANARDLPDELGVPADSEFIRVENGAYGFTQHWVRIDDSPDDWEMEFGHAEERVKSHDPDGHRAAWAAHVRDILGRLDRYPLFNDETSSNVLEEWAEAGWADWGRRDLLHELRKIDDEFADWLDDEERVEWCKIGDLRQHWPYDYWHAEGGEGGVYFDIERIARSVLAANVNDWMMLPGNEDVLADSLILHAAHVLGSRHGPSGAVVAECVEYAVRQAYPDGATTAIVETFNANRNRWTHGAFGMLCDLFDEYQPVPTAWPAILRSIWVEWANQLNAKPDSMVTT